MLSEQTHYLSPALALRCVELQAQQSRSHHAEPVYVHHIICILTLMAKNTGRETHGCKRTDPTENQPHSWTYIMTTTSNPLLYI